jgi:hypothetical protein
LLPTVAAAVALAVLAGCDDEKPAAVGESPTAGTCGGVPARAVFRPLPPRFSYGPAPKRLAPTVVWDTRGVAVGRPVVRGIVRTTHAGHGGSSLGANLPRAGQVKRAGFVIVQATSDPNLAMDRIRVAAKRNGVTEPLDYPLQGVRWLAVDFQRGAAFEAVIGCHVVQVGGANAYDANDIEDCLSLRRERLKVPVRRNSYRAAPCVSGSPGAR